MLRTDILFRMSDKCNVRRDYEVVPTHSSFGVLSMLFKKKRDNRGKGAVINNNRITFPLIFLLVLKTKSGTRGTENIYSLTQEIKHSAKNRERLAFLLKKKKTENQEALLLKEKLTANQEI